LLAVDDDPFCDFVPCMHQVGVSMNAMNGVFFIPGYVVKTFGLLVAAVVNFFSIACKKGSRSRTAYFGAFRSGSCFGTRRTEPGTTVLMSKQMRNILSASAPS